MNREKLEQEVMEKANFFYICKYNGKNHLRECIREALAEVTKLNEVQVCKIFDIFSKDVETIKTDFEDYVEEIYNKMQEMGAE